jgi:predicted nucleic acid-binding protein
MVELYRDTGAEWVLPWAILPEVDYLVTRHGLVAAQRFLSRYADLRLGLVDAVVMAVAERLRAEAIATLDLRHFAAVSMDPSPRLLPRAS